MKGYICTIFALLGSLLLTVSCGREGRQADVLSRLDSLVEADADSALRLMGRMQDDGWTRRDAMRLELLRAKAMNRADSLFTTDSLMRRVCRYYRRHGTRNERMLSLYLLGCTYRDMGSAPRAIETWQQAVAEADTNRQDCDLSTLMRIHSQMAELYSRQKLTKYMASEDSIAEALCWKMNDTLSAIAFEQASCNRLYNEGDYKGCIERAQYLYERYMDWGLPDKAAKVAVFCVKSYIKLSDYANTKKYLDIYESYCLSETDHRKINGGLAPYYIYKGNYYLGIGDIDSAEHCFRRAMPEMHQLHNDVDVYYRLYQIFGLKHQPDSTLKYVHLYAAAKEKECDALKTQATADAKNLYDYSVEQSKANKEQRKAAMRARYIAILIGILVLILCFTLYTWGRMTRKELKLFKKEAKINVLKIWLTEVRGKLERVQSELAALRRRAAELETELSTLKKIQDKTNVSEEQIQERDRLKEMIHEKEQSIDQLEHQIEDLKQLMENTEKKEKMEIKEKEETKEMMRKMGKLKALPIFGQLRLCIDKPKENPLYKGYWDQLQKVVESTVPNFYGLTHAGGPLSDGEYRVCLLTAGGFSPKDINRLLRKKEYASTTKKRLLDKIFKVKNKKPAEFDKLLFSAMDI